ncbi:hypothetical protein I203_101378 [Kwoniella mangroviensis CBS 8507]|uniref:uncharacterized protein n=1 Tax=Kwoniella mangroviensis CBS 8507 TaxID=1296122 RepID=UPI003070DA1D
MFGDSTGAAFEALVGNKETGERLNEYQIEHHLAESEALQNGETERRFSSIYHHCCAIWCLFIVYLPLLDGPVRPFSAPLVDLKRKRLSNTMNEEAGPASARVNGGKEQDIKPLLRVQRLQHLEGRIKPLTSRLKSARNGEGDVMVDLTNDSYGEWCV